MNCFPCFSSQKSKKEGSKREHDASFDDQVQSSATENKVVASDTAENGNITTQAFNFRELAAATKNFRQECLLGEGGFGRVYRGTLAATGKVVAVKQLDRNAMEENKEFFVEVGQLSLLQHPNLVNLIGYCADGDQRLLVYEFMPGGSLEDHLRDMKAGGKPLDWATRMKIAYGTAQGLEYLHEKANPPVIYRDLKSSNVLLDEEFNPKLSDIGLDKLGPPADNKMPMQPRMMDTGYNAPEYSGSGTLTAMADVYSFGVVLLELITGRRPIDTTKPVDEQNLVAWAQPIFKEPKHFPEMADPLLKKRFPERGLNQAVAIAAMCVQEEAAARPLMSDLVGVLSFLSVATEENSIPPTLPPSISSKLHCISTKLQFLECPDAGMLKVQKSSVNDVNDADKQSELDDDDEGDDKYDNKDNDDDEKSVSSTRSSSVNSLRKSSLTHDNSRRSTDGGSPSLSQNSSARSQFSLGNDSKGAHSLSQKSSKKSKFSSSQKKLSKKSEDASFFSSDEDSRKLSAVSPSHKSSTKSPEDDANSSSGYSSDENFSSNHEKSSKKLLDESGHASQKGSRKSTDGRTVSMSHKSSMKSQDANDSIGHKSSRKLTDVISLGRKNSKIKSKVDGSSSSRHRTSSKKTPEGILSLSRKKSHNEINSSASIRKSRRKSKKPSNDDDSLSQSSSSSNGGSQDEN